MIAKILVDIKSKNVDKTYDYLVPEKYFGIIEIGARVIVPFGNRKVMGFCLEIAQKSEYQKELKAIESVIDMESYLTPELISLADSMRMETSSMLIQILETMLPAALKVVYRPKLEMLDYHNMNDSLRSLFEYNEEILLDNVPQELYPIVKQEIKSQNIRQIYDIKPKNKALSHRYVKLTKKGLDGKVSEKQKKVLEYLFSKKNNESLVKNVVDDLEITESSIKTLEKNNYVNIFYKEVYRKVEPLYNLEKKEIILNDEQSNAYQSIISSFGVNHTFLLHGITGSGKTEIYIKAMRKAIELGKTVIFLVPEISLTPMMMSRFRAEFGDNVAMLHSGLSILEKYDEWRRIVHQQAKIVVGARSACFAPVNNLGLIIVDECHEATYKQESAPNYYALDVLNKRAKYHNSTLILGSATPNIESFARSHKGYYELLTLKKRAMNASLPKIEVVDMKKEFKSGNSSNFSRLLQEELASRLDRKEQSILLLNRRGYSNFMICRNCGHVFMCPNCDISLTYHEYSHSLKCHYCSHDEQLPKTCTKCGSEDLHYMGTGTQKAEDELHRLFPEAKIIRMDNDTTRTKNAHERLLHDFETSGDILLGTQMIAKGLDFPRVTLVGIIQADNNLFISDFRSAEKTFQLLMQVSGRSGRRITEGKVVVQAFNPDHYAIDYACRNDYVGFYNYEMNLRRIARYSPFYYMVVMKVLGPNIRNVFYNGMEVVKHLKRSLPENFIVLGPAIPVVRRINNRYNCEIMIKYKNIENLNDVLNEVMDKYQLNENYISIDRFPDVG